MPAGLPQAEKTVKLRRAESTLAETPREKQIKTLPGNLRKGFFDVKKNHAIVACDMHLQKGLTFGVHNSVFNLGFIFCVM